MKWTSSAGFPYSPAELFDTFASNRADALSRRLASHFDLVAAPGSRINGGLQPGDLLVRCAPGESRLTHMAVLATGDLFGADAVAAAGLVGERRSPGLYAQVEEGGAFPHRMADRFARRIADADGWLSRDHLILRPRVRGADIFPFEQPSENFFPVRGHIQIGDVLGQPVDVDSIELSVSSRDTSTGNEVDFIEGSDPTAPRQQRLALSVPSFEVMVPTAEASFRGFLVVRARWRHPRRGGRRRVDVTARLPIDLNAAAPGPRRVIVMAPVPAETRYLWANVDVTDFETGLPIQDASRSRSTKVYQPDAKITSFSIAPDLIRVSDGG